MTTTIARVTPLLLPAMLLTSFAVAAAGADVRAWIGHVAPPWPAGFEHIGGSCIPAEGDVCAYGVALLRQGNQRWFVMSRSLREGVHRRIGGL